MLTLQACTWLSPGITVPATKCETPAHVTDVTPSRWGCRGHPHLSIVSDDTLRPRRLFIMSPKAVIVYECLPAWQGPASCRPSSTALPDAECSSDELSYLLLTGRRRVEEHLHDPAYTSDCSDVSRN